MAKVTATPAVVPSFTERVVADTVIAVQTGDCAVVRGVIVGLDDRVVAHARARRDARCESLVAHYLAQ